MKIQINSLQALERLIGGDTELEIEARNNIVQDFSKKHLKPLLTSASQQIINDLLSDTKKHIADTVGEELGFVTKTSGEGYYKKTIITLNDVQKEFLNRLVTEYVSKELSDVYYKVVENRIAYYKTQIEQTVDHHMAKYTDKMVQDAIQKRVEETLKNIKA